MPVFCTEFAWCSPDAFRRLKLRDYRVLREYLVKRSEAQQRA